MTSKTDLDVVAAQLHETSALLQQQQNVQLQKQILQLQQQMFRQQDIIATLKRILIDTSEETKNLRETVTGLETDKSWLKRTMAIQQETIDILLSDSLGVCPVDCDGNCNACTHQTSMAAADPFAATTGIELEPSPAEVPRDPFGF
ncbi:hypothetical protein ABW21_db0202201 [Orbilia brochopaga]|nr:hypothetical protein ABW21_db0202201 [Drechslerella brochopaga]